MLFIRLYDDQLAQASYVIGCGTSGAAVVVDPNRMADRYIAAAEAERTPHLCRDGDSHPHRFCLRLP